jgi:hypothetical protein
LPNLLERGFETFSAMEGIADFVTTIVAREARLSQGAVAGNDRLLDDPAIA